MKIARRTTTRKAIIERILDEQYSGGPVLLEELRWKTLICQYGYSFTEMSDAKLKSFARTVREHMPQLVRKSIPIGKAPVGMIARAALYRLRSRLCIDRFLEAFKQNVFLNVGYPDHDAFRRDEFGHRVWNPKKSRYRKKLPRVTVGCYFLERQISGEPWPDYFNEVAFAKTVLPKSHDLVLVSHGSSEFSDYLNQVAAVPWNLSHFYNKIDPGIGDHSTILNLDRLERLP